MKRILMMIVVLAVRVCRREVKHEVCVAARGLPARPPGAGPDGGCPGCRSAGRSKLSWDGRRRRRRDVWGKYIGL